MLRLGRVGFLSLQINRFGLEFFGNFLKLRIVLARSLGFTLGFGGGAVSVVAAPLLGRLGPLLKLLNPAGGVDQLLLTGVEGMAIGTNFDGNFRHGASGRELDVTTVAVDFSVH